MTSFNCLKDFLDVPSRSFLGPLFLIHINNLPNDVVSLVTQKCVHDHVSTHTSGI